MRTWCNTVFDAARALFEITPTPDRSDAPAPRLAALGTALEARDAFEDAYQMAKAGLLQARAGGTVDVVAVYERLGLNDLRRAVGRASRPCSAWRLRQAIDAQPWRTHAAAARSDNQASVRSRNSQIAQKVFVAMFL